MNVTRLLLRLVLGRRLPITSGELRVRGPVAPITIRRDSHGIPHIDAESDADAAFALGFCQGQDRTAQLEIHRRLARGQLAEWVGEVAVGADRVSRRIGFRRAAEAQLPVMSDATRAQVLAFAAGITAGSTAGLSKKPHEFALVGGEPSPWDGADVLAILKLQSFALPSNWDVELARLRILLADGPEALQAVDPVLGQTRSVSDGVTGRDPIAHAAGSPALEALAADLAELQRFLPPGGGSNNWVIAGSRTQSGKPLLASDPHLAPTAPAPWYLAHIRTPEWEVVGAVLAGTPSFPIGHNGFAAWGVTAGLTDNSDFFVETLGPDGNSVREADGSFTPCPVVREAIRVKGKPDVIEEVLVTPRGPLISPVLKDMPLALSLRAVWLDALPINGFLGINRARSFSEFRRTFEHWPVLQLNVAYADVEGTIGWQLTGQLPKRRGGHGLIPRPADLPDSGWDGYLPFDAMPFVENPECGYWATANNAPEGVGSRETGDGRQGSEESGRGTGTGMGTKSPDPCLLSPVSCLLSPEFGADYCERYRVWAIVESLMSRGGWTVADCNALQQDVRCIPWEEIRDTVLSLAPTDTDAQEGLALLREWDGRLDSESPAACVYELFAAEMYARTTRVKAPNSWRVALGDGGLGTIGHSLFMDRRAGHLTNLLRTQPAGWFLSWPVELCDALTTVVKKLRREVGPGSAYWAWGHVRRLRLEHPLFGNHRWLSPAFNLGPVPCGGDCNTVSQAGSYPTDPTGFTHNMCNLRTVFDLADLSKSTFVLCGGQSGNPCSPHYADQFPIWQAGETITIPWSQADVIRQAKDTLRLLPQG